MVLGNTLPIHLQLKAEIGRADFDGNVKSAHTRHGILPDLVPTATHPGLYYLASLLQNRRVANQVAYLPHPRSHCHVIRRDAVAVPHDHLGRPGDGAVVPFSQLDLETVLFVFAVGIEMITLQITVDGK